MAYAYARICGINADSLDFAVDPSMGMLPRGRPARRGVNILGGLFFLVLSHSVLLVLSFVIEKAGR